MTKPRNHPPAAPAAVLALALSAALAGCGQPVTGSTATSGRDALYFADGAAGLPVIYQGEPYTADLSISGGAGPYSLRLGSGTLPPGVSLSGQRLSGTPTKTGTYKFTLEVTDSTLSTRSKEYTLNVNTLPPLALVPTLPGGEIRGETRIPLVITAPRNVRAAQLSWELPAGARVTRVQASEQSGVLFWKQDGQMLLLDLGFKTVPRNGVRVALISVKPSKPVTLTAAKLGYEARDGQGKLLAEKKMPQPEKPQAEKTEPATTPEKKADETGKPADTKPTDTKPTDTKPTDTKPAENKPVETPVTPPVKTPPAPGTKTPPAPGTPPPADTTPPTDGPGSGLPPGTPPKPPGEQP